MGLALLFGSPTSFAIIEIFQRQGQADHSGRNACTTRLCCVLSSLVCDHAAAWNAQEQRGIHKSTRVRDFEQVFIFGGSRRFDEGCVLHGRGGICESAHPRDFVRVSIFTWTVVLTEEELDWLQSGVVYPCARPPQKGRPPVSKRQVKRREGQHFHLSHCPPRPMRTSTHTCRVSKAMDDASRAVQRMRNPFSTAGRRSGDHKFRVSTWCPQAEEFLRGAEVGRLQTVALAVRQLHHNKLDKLWEQSGFH